MFNVNRLEAEICLAQPSRRLAHRHSATAAGSLRAWKGQAEPIRLVDISPEGCGFEGRWPLAAGTRVWLRLPGLEPWAATVVWFGEGRGGLAFERALHPAVAIRFAAD